MPILNTLWPPPLMYSIYKMLPNDTDSTVLREEGDIDGLFAFIDDHYDYHTANDTVENLDLNITAAPRQLLLPLLTLFCRRRPVPSTQRSGQMCT